MKKVFLTAIVALASLTASAQFSLQPKVGMNVSDVTDADNMKAKVGLVAGVEADYQISPLFSLSAGVNYSQQGAKYDTNNSDVDTKLKLEYINVPIMANFHVYQGLSLKAGLQPGFLTTAKGQAKVGKGEGSVDIKDQCNSVDLSLPLGLSYEFSGFVIDARYNLGLTKIYKDDYNVDSKNSVFQFTVGYKFAL